MLFTGEYEYTIDSKGRLAIPSEIRARMCPETDGEAFYLTLGPKGRLRLYPEKGFERLADQLEKGLVTDESLQEFDQLLFPLSSRLEFDAAGRVRIPERMRRRGGLETQKKVVLIGVRDHLQIRDYQAWQAELDGLLEKQAEIFERFARKSRTNSTPGSE